ncbi:MAG TPA: LPS export ABC transporter periplasmic protein LptC [Candidatus Acidoferrales bacterium]|nr:LPS export ABC transporter periplasmic protein LptC [Candidatus Acidoferrales bacterium]
MKALRRSLAERPGLWVGGFVAALVLAGGYFLITALLTPDIPPSLGQPQIQMRQVIGQGERGTQLGWRFVADSSELSTDDEVTTYHNVRRGTYYLDGKPAYELTADQVTLDMRSQNYTATGAVHVWSVRKRDLSDLRTETVLWNNPLQMITCPAQVRVRYKGFDFVTSRLQSNFGTGVSSLGATTIQGKGI